MVDEVEMGREEERTGKVCMGRWDGRRIRREGDVLRSEGEARVNPRRQINRIHLGGTMGRME